MMTVITGEMFHTSYGLFIVAENWTGPAKKGNVIEFKKKHYTVKRIIPPKKPDGQWSVEVIPALTEQS